MAARFWVGGTGTWDASDTTHWASSSGGAGGQSVPGSSDDVTLDGSSGGGTVTVSHATNTILSLTMGAFTGTLDFATNDNNISMGTFSGTGTGVRTLNMGDGTWTLTATTGTVWNNATVTNFTLNADGSTINIAATGTASRTFAGGSKTYNNLSITNPASNVFFVRISGSNTFANLTVNANVRHLQLAGSPTNNTITGAFTFGGTAAAPCLLETDTPASTLTVSGANTLTGAFIQGITKAGAGSITARESFDGGGNTSVTIIPPARVIGG